MATKITKIIGATEKEVRQKKFNIYLGISLGNKWFNEKNIKAYIEWGLKYTAKEKILIIIGDKLHSINYEVRSGYNKKKALRKVLREGDKIEEIIKKIISDLPKEQQVKVEIIRWGDVLTSKNYDKMRKLVYIEFNKNPEFKEAILKIVKNNIEKSPKTFSQEELKKLAQYVLDELPLFLRGINWKNNVYNILPYPEFTAIDYLIKKVQHKDIFQDLYNKMDRHQSILIEMKII